METTFIIFVIYPTVPFKSYYVVWKLENIVFKASIDSEFKSYYVVWKLGTAFELVLHCYPFKSYYVVWKRDLAERQGHF